jgi:hypothetical protein
VNASQKRNLVRQVEARERPLAPYHARRREKIPLQPGLTGMAAARRRDQGCRLLAAPVGIATVAGVAIGGAEDEPDLAEQLELRDELLIACRDLLLGVGTTHAAVLVAHIDALLDLDDEVSPGSQR